MKAVIQKVKESSVKIDGVVKSQINCGLLILLGIEVNDSIEDVIWLSKKICQLRIFNDKNGIMNFSVQDVNGDIMIISQFTLLAKTKKGNRPSYINAANPSIAIPLYNSFIENIEFEIKKKVKTGEFGAMMEVFLINDGPVTIIIDTKNKE